VKGKQRKKGNLDSKRMRSASGGKAKEAKNPRKLLAPVVARACRSTMLSRSTLSQMGRKMVRIWDSEPVSIKDITDGASKCPKSTLQEKELPPDRA
jgi:hypothetical protein